MIERSTLVVHCYRNSCPLSNYDSYFTITCFKIVFKPPPCLSRHEIPTTYRMSNVYRLRFYPPLIIAKAIHDNFQITFRSLQLLVSRNYLKKISPVFQSPRNPHNLSIVKFIYILRFYPPKICIYDIDDLLCSFVKRHVLFFQPKVG